MNNVVPSIFLMIILVSSTFLLSHTQLSNAQTSNTCTPQPLGIQNASGSEPSNPPSKTIDNNLNTAWADFGLPSWIHIFTGSGKVICSVDIAWYRGNFRHIDFAISVWNSPINKWVTVFSGTSSGTTANFERYNIPDMVAANVMITVMRNSEHNWATISEIELNGYAGSTSGSVDKFGIKKIYPTKTGGQQ